MTSINLTAAGSATDAIDLESLPRLSHRGEEEARRRVDVVQQGVDSNASSQETIAPPKWNHPPINKYRTAATFWSFLVVGMNDGSYGALVPLLEDYYHKNHTLLSLVFLTPFVGYAIASAINSLMHISMYVLVGIGNGLADAAWCSFIGQMMNSHEMSGILQACYALGATIAPLVATGLSGDGMPGWYAFFYVMTAASVLELIALTITFWTQTGAVYLSEAPSASGAKSGRMRQVLKNKLSWIFAFFVFGYCGAEVALGGWVVVFMQKRRNASAIVGSSVATGFWGGMTIGRLFLSLVTVRLGEFWAMFLYIGVTIALELVFWLVPNLVVSAVAAALIGVAMGPMYPVAVVLMTKVMPRSLHVGTIGFAASFGGSGGAILPFAVGAIAQAKGVQTLQPIVLAICVVLGCLWLLLPRRPVEKNQTDGHESCV
ncbi:tetracycline resistance protein [Fusarium bulbicola]|nr:tetracycline resistance protein [Fusarium bulbicola]